MTARAASRRASSLRIIPAVRRAAPQLAVHLARLKDLRVTQGEAHILSLLIETGPLTIAQLHRAFSHRRSTLTSILDRLAARGLVRRDSAASDRRTFTISLTASGNLLAAETLRALRRVERETTGHLTAAELRGFEQVLKALERTLSKT
jgi:DNA-binding MarR family transcriptional regulator